MAKAGWDTPADGPLTRNALNIHKRYAHLQTDVLLHNILRYLPFSACSSAYSVKQLRKRI